MNRTFVTCLLAGGIVGHAGCGTGLSQVDQAERDRLERQIRVEGYRRLAAEARKKSEEARVAGDYVEAAKFLEVAEQFDAKASDPDHGDRLSPPQQEQVRNHIRLLRDLARRARSEGDIAQALRLDQEADRLQAQLIHQ